MTQSIFALPDSDIAPVTDGAMMTGASVGLENSVRGDVAEYEFCKQACLRGWRASHAGSGTQGYDVILSGKSQRPIFVQVKHGFLRRRPNAVSWYYQVKNSVRGKLYSPHAYDVLALYMWDRDQWLFFTRGELGNRTETTFTPPEFRKNAVKSNACDDRNPNNWELLDDVAQSLTNLEGRTADVLP